jgi:hypothetical protein
MDAELARLLNSSATDRQKAIELINEYWNDADDNKDTDTDDEFDADLELLVPPDSDEEDVNTAHVDENNNKTDAASQPSARNVDANQSHSSPAPNYEAKRSLIMLKAQNFK